MHSKSKENNFSTKKEIMEKLHRKFKIIYTSTAEIYKMIGRIKGKSTLSTYPITENDEIIDDPKEKV
jgi:hypothetical protein